MGPFTTDHRYHKEDILKVINQILFEGIPVAENINFTFHLKNISISWREQAVRHRVGLKFGESLGADMIPELPSSTWWSQSMRVIPKDEFYEMGEFRIPDSIKDSPAAEVMYRRILKNLQEGYTALTSMGIPNEDAREVLPMALTHDITWTMNLATLIHIIGKRACWVLQSGLWGPVIQGMVDELCEKVSPIFRNLVQPPCFKGGKFNSCVFHATMVERFNGRDGMPPCPMYVNHHNHQAVEEGDKKGACWIPDLNPESGPTTDISTWMTTDKRQEKMLTDGIKRFERLWKLNVRTGDPL